MFSYLSLRCAITSSSHIYGMDGGAVLFRLRQTFWRIPFFFRNSRKSASGKDFILREYICTLFC